jgi:hypothetical protein
MQPVHFEILDMPCTPVWFSAKQCAEWHVIFQLFHVRFSASETRTSRESLIASYMALAIRGR